MTPYRWAVAAFLTTVTLIALAASPAPGVPNAVHAADETDFLPLPVLHADYDAPQLLLRGDVPGRAEHEAILRRARALYGAEHVLDQLRIAPVLHPSWMSADYLPDLRAAVRARASLYDARLQIAGEVRSAAGRASLVAQVDEFRARGLEVDARIAVSRPASAR